MSQHDDEIREVFREGRAEDRDEAPSFGATWGAASEKTGGRRWVWGAAALAAAAALVIIVWPRPVAPPDPTEVAETHPVPDIPVDEPPTEESEPLELAEWSPDDTLGGPTDFLLESDEGLGSLPTSDLHDSVLSLERGLDMEL